MTTTPLLSAGRAAAVMSIVTAPVPFDRALILRPASRFAPAPSTADNSAIFRLFSPFLGRVCREEARLNHRESACLRRISTALRALTATFSQWQRRFSLSRCTKTIPAALVLSAIGLGRPPDLRTQ